MRGSSGFILQLYPARAQVLDLRGCRSASGQGLIPQQASETKSDQVLGSRVSTVLFRMCGVRAVGVRSTLR